MGQYELAKKFLDAVKECSIIYSRIIDIAKLYFIIGKNLEKNQKNTIETLECYRISAEYFSKNSVWKYYCLVQLFHSRFLKDNNHLNESFDIGNAILKVCNLIEPDVYAGKKLFQRVF
jgi:hypothetical protein